MDDQIWLLVFIVIFNVFQPLLPYSMGEECMDSYDEMTGESPRP
jgi:hypothetical protein